MNEIETKASRIKAPLRMEDREFRQNDTYFRGCSSETRVNEITGSQENGPVKRSRASLRLYRGLAETLLQHQGGRGGEGKKNIPSAIRGRR